MQKKLILSILLFVASFFLNGNQVEAANEKVFFDEDSYEWGIGTHSSIGVYVSGDDGISSVEMNITYDPEILEYKAGGTLIEPGMVRIGATDIEALEYREILILHSLTEGTTPITIQDVVIVNNGGETIYPNPISVNMSVIPIANMPEEIAENEESTTEVVLRNNAGATSQFKNVITIIIVLLVTILIVLLVIKIGIAVSNKKRRRRRRQMRKQRLLREMREERTNRGQEPGTNKLEASDDGEEQDSREIKIAAKNITMQFKREKDESSSIKEMIVRTIKRQRSYEMFTALNDVSFNVYEGEVLGIIGTNGAGKSTILKIISGALSPTQGNVEVNKNDIQLLTLGTGFDVELTGRENVYLNGAIIGYTKEYIDEKYADIVAFAELEGFMEEKVRNYSSGMVSRLGFAIATARETPEILILDEVLSVGDMFFREKSEARIKEMIHGGSTVLMVSHSTGVIEKNCDRAVWIEKGELRAIGKASEVCGQYAKMQAS
ncbi:MAG: ATP-binding cassette domain-containing protein [Suipraeoptans sp.]